MDLTLTPIISTIQYFIGGIFGLYLIFIMWRIFSGAKYNRILKEIRDEVKEINKKLENEKRPKKPQRR